MFILRMPQVSKTSGAAVDAKGRPFRSITESLYLGPVDETIH